MGKVEETIWTVAEPIVQENGMELIEVEFVKEGAEWFLRIFMDKEGGTVDLDDCEAVSRKVSEILDVSDPIEQEYRLEVSSPGIERPLRRTKDFVRFCGEKIQVKTYTEVQGKKKLIGILKAASEDEITVNADGEDVVIPMKQIAKANLVWEF